MNQHFPSFIFSIFNVISRYAYNCLTQNSLSDKVMCSYSTVLTPQRPPYLKCCPIYWSLLMRRILYWPFWIWAQLLTAWITRSCCLNCSPSYFGLGGAVLAWIRSFLSDRIQRVCFNGCLSLVLLLMYGVPQGSVTGLLMFLLYAAEVFDIIASFQLTRQPYADDTQVYISAPVGETQLCCVWPQDLKPTTNGPPITRIVARFTHAPAQDSHVPALECWLQLWVSCTVVRRCCDCSHCTASSARLQISRLDSRIN